MYEMNKEIIQELRRIGERLEDQSRILKKLLDAVNNLAAGLKEMEESLEVAIYASAPDDELRSIKEEIRRNRDC
jgi:uncharacterized protein YgbK (DUF1537 family)